MTLLSRSQNDHNAFILLFCMLKDISHVLLLFCTFWMVHNMATRWRCLHVHKTSIIHPFSLTEQNKRSFTCSDSIIHINVVDVAKTLNIQHFLNSILHINFQALSLSVDNHNSHMKMSQKWPMYLAEMPLHKSFHQKVHFCCYAPVVGEICFATFWALYIGLWLMWSQSRKQDFVFLAVHNSSIGDLTN